MPVSSAVRFVVEGEPVPKARPRLNRHTGSVYTPRATVAYEKAVAWQAIATRARFTGPVCATLDFYCGTRSRASDLDNLVKAVLDGLQAGGAFDNDVQVRELHARKLPLDVDGARTVIELCPLDFSPTL